LSPTDYSQELYSATSSPRDFDRATSPRDFEGVPRHAIATFAARLRPRDFDSPRTEPVIWRVPVVYFARSSVTTSGGCWTSAGAGAKVGGSCCCNSTRSS
jgi:hypothetical protein